MKTYEGVLIKESLSDDSIIDYLKVNKVELWKSDGNPKYWTALFFSSDSEDFPERLSKAMLSSSGDSEKGTTWYVDFKVGNEKYIVLKDKVLKYQIGNQAEKEYVCNECRKLGIPDKQLDWSE